MSISGILKRKKPNNHNEDENKKFKDLFIFGYSCRLFRDDAKALEIENSLIPLNGNENLKIDRFDVRATLSDKELSILEAPQTGWWSTSDIRNFDLSKEEQIAEQLAEEERYYSLFHNEIEEKMYEEEEQKRMQYSYGEFQFDYSSTNKPDNGTNDQDENSEDSDDMYVAPLNLNIPTEILLPITMKQHAIIEKTAKFISEQGQQMEILIKAKQSNNPQFEFLNYNNRLNQYYKFILDAFKNDTYPKKTETILNDNVLQEVSTFSEHNYHEHEETKPKFLPTIKYVPSADCSYTQLISKIKGVPIPFVPQITNLDRQEILNSKEISKQSILEKIPSTSNVEVKKISSGLALALAYGSNSESEEEIDPPETSVVCTENVNATKVLYFPIPSESLKNIIDKTAAYVKKNGKQFEETLKLKGDDRFLFLHEKNEYYPYYTFKVTGKTPRSLDLSIPKHSPKKTLSSVSFSIKQKEESSKPSKAPIKPALHNSDDEIMALMDSNPTSKSNLPEKVIKAIQMVENQLVVKSSNNCNTETSKSRFDSHSTITNLSSITEQSTKLEIQKEIRRAEEKVKDKLALIAREKLGLISKEKQLQLERKKKAMAFLSQIKANDPTSISDNIKANKKEESDNESIHSIPISSYGDNELSISKSSSRSPSFSNNHKSKKSKHNKKKSKRRSHNKSRSKSPHEYKSSSRKSKKRKHDRD